MGRFWHHRVSYRARLAAEANKNSLDITSTSIQELFTIPIPLKKSPTKKGRNCPMQASQSFMMKSYSLPIEETSSLSYKTPSPFSLVPIVLEHKENRDSRNTTKSLPENYVNLSMVSKVQAKFPLCLLWTVKMNIKLSEYYTTPFPTPKWISPKLP